MSVAGTGRAAVRWVTGNPLWAAATDAADAATDADAATAELRRPALLRFDSDTFMDDLAALLAADPAALAAHRAVPVGFRAAPPGAPDGYRPSPGRLKLYQPFHGDFNLVAASLVCGLIGLPDHTVRPGEGEQVGFVLRRADRTGELAWAHDPTGRGRRWAPVPMGMESAVIDGEEIFPMFPVGYRDADTGAPRRLHVGLVPTSSRETFRAAARAEAFPLEGSPPRGGRADDDPRWNAFDLGVVGPLADLRSLPARVRQPGLEEDASAHLLLDFADLLRRHIPRVWEALRTGTPPSRRGEAALYRALLSPAEPGTGQSWREALLSAAAQWAAITGETTEPVALRVNLRRSTITVRIAEEGDPPGAPSLQGLIRGAIADPVPPDGVPDGVDVPKIEPTGGAVYRIRCVYRRPKCAPFPTDVVSLPTEDFAIAPVFDPDAPARQIRIAMPVDTGIRDLRKFRKNVGFVLSNQLRGQMNRITDLKKALDGELGEEESWNLGVICQFSIPIITICALIVLMIFLSLLNIVFFWRAFFRICLPVPVRSRS
ncbi:hypothetical protein AB0K60_13275 [Thermopolyspora sp. NPDC052614]|uniref:hypothetical protein n=1 Tax=Thermopolyspora sp. NPDC052614 TaxID=3155682 RepID=UPI003415F322